MLQIPLLCDQSTLMSLVQLFCNPQVHVPDPGCPRLHDCHSAIGTPITGPLPLCGKGPVLAPNGVSRPTTLGATDLPHYPYYKYVEEKTSSRADQNLLRG